MAKGPDEIIRDEIRALAAYHVPDSGGMVKLDAMENPYLLPHGVRERIAKLVSDAEINRYPDAGAARLKSRLRGVLRIPEGVELLLGNGSDEIIQMLTLAVARPGATVLGVEPAFVMFRLIASFCGLRFVGVPLREDFSLDPERIAAAIDEHQPALIFIAYPNNPTGNLFDAAAIDAVIANAPGLVVIDEAYHAFAERTYIHKLREHPNLLVMRTLSKSGFAGLRLGFLAGADPWLKHIDKVRLPYNVGVLTQLVAEEAFQHQGLLDEQASAIKAERTRLYAALEREPRTTPFPSDANFILFKTASAQATFDGLKRQGVLVKNLHGSHPALEGCLRVTVGTPDENDRFLEALHEALA